MRKLIFVTLFFFSPVSRAIQQEYQLEAYVSYSSYNLSKNNLNPENNILKNPKQESQIDIRQDYRLSNPDSYKFIIRPRFIISYKQYEVDKKNSSSTIGKWDLSDLFLENQILDNLKLVTGLQVYQWGPGEFFNPTNPIYKTNAGQKNSYFKEKGKVLTRLNYDPNDKWNLVFLTEFLNNNESSFMADTSFEKKYLIKVETNELSSNNYAGLVVGQVENSEFFLGEYASFNFFDSYSFYFDIKHPKGNKSYRPEMNLSNNYDMELSDTSHQNQLLTFANVGIRYEGRFDLRAEFIHQSFGFSYNEFQQAKSSTQSFSSKLENNIKRFYKTGLDFYGKNYLYFSLRLSDLGIKNDTSLYLRNLNSLMDNSKSLQLSAEKNAFDSIVFNIDINYNLGDKDSELMLQSESSFFIGLKWSL